MEIFNSIKELDDATKSLKKEWCKLKSTQYFPFAKYTDECFKKLEDTIKLNYNDLGFAIGIGEYNLLKKMHLTNKLTLENVLGLSSSGNIIADFTKFSSQFNDEYYWKYLSESYIIQDYSPINYSILKKLFSANRKEKHFLMTKSELVKFQNLATPITIFRAMSAKEAASKKYRLSWTLSKKVAHKFKERNELLYGKPHIVKEITVEKSSVIAYFDRRNEEEIIYLPNKNNMQPF